MLPALEGLLALGLSQSDIARAMHLRRQTVGNWVRGTRQITPQMMADLRELLDVAQEGMRVGLSVHEAIQGWAPTTTYTHAGRLTVSPRLMLVGPDQDALIAGMQDALRQGDVQTYVVGEVVQAQQQLAELLQAVKDGAPITAAWARMVRHLGLVITRAGETLQKQRTED